MKLFVYLLAILFMGAHNLWADPCWEICNDFNDCTHDECLQSTFDCLNINYPDATLCFDAPGFSQGYCLNGLCRECAFATHCTNAPSECQDAICVSGNCQYPNLPNNSACSGGFCQNGICIPEAVEVDAGDEDAGLEDSGTNDAGDEDSGTHDAGDEDAGIFEPEDEFPAHCYDAMHNFAETDIDCGGPCSSCTIGSTCLENNDCLSENCRNNRCILLICEYAQNPDDCDDDGLPNYIEDSNGNGLVDDGETDPFNPDSDGDGLLDGEEDRNANGLVDADESDPRVKDTDNGGAHDGIEREFNTNPRDGSDDELALTRYREQYGFDDHKRPDAGLGQGDEILASSCGGCANTQNSLFAFIAFCAVLYRRKK